MKRVSTDAALARAQASLGPLRRSNGFARFRTCPACGSTSTRAFWIGHDQEGYATAGCHRCKVTTRTALELLGLLDGRVYEPPPDWKPSGPSESERRARASQLLAQALASPKVDAALEYANQTLLWPDIETMKRLRSGEREGRVVLSVWEDSDHPLPLGICCYAMPGTPARERSDRKLIAHGRRGLWPRPRDVVDGVHLPGWLVLVEGPAAAATALGCGLACVSYPSASGLAEADVERVAARSRRVVVIGDCDDAGREAIDATVLRLETAGVEAVGVDLDPERDDGFDVGDYLREVNDPDPLVAGARLAREIEEAL